MSKAQYKQALHLAGPDHLRALAIALVFIFHYRLFPHPAWIDNIGSFGWTGVDLFFVLSGYLIAVQVFKRLAEGNFSVTEFYAKRLFRIVPAYLAVLALYFLVPAFREWEHLPPLWKFLTFTQNIGLDLRTSRTFSHAWSLCIEEQFYLFFPLIVVALVSLKAQSKLIIGLIAALLVAGIVIRGISWLHFVAPHGATGDAGISWYKWIYYPTWNRLDGLLAGISIAGLQQFYPTVLVSLQRRSTLLLISGLLLLIASWLLYADTLSARASVWGFPLIAFGYGLMLTAAISPNTVLRHHVAITAFIARISYSVYLTHKAAIHLAQQWLVTSGYEKDSSLMFLMSVIVSLAFAVVLHYGIERPFLRYRNHILSKTGALSKK